MHKYVILLISSMLAVASLQAQVNPNPSDFEKYPIFPDCETVSIADIPNCFNEKLIQFFIDNFEMPSKVKEQQYEGQMVMLFEVTPKGEFKLLNTEAVYTELKDEAQKVFDKLPKVQPATYSGEPVYIQFAMPVKIPLSRNKIKGYTISDADVVTSDSNALEDRAASKELENIKSKPFERKVQYQSQLNIPFSHETYSRFDKTLNRIGVNTHTASRPFLYDVVNNYHDFDSIVASLELDKKSWLGRKFFNENLVRFQGDNYWFTINIGADLQLGTETDDRKVEDFTYNNTRAAFIQGGIGKKFSFYTAVYESQGRFAQYFNDYARSLRPDGGNPAVIPGRGIAALGRGGDFDYPVAEGYISYTPSKYFNFQLGTGQQFIGDGYRSLLLSDVSSNYPYFKINTTLWRLKYTNTWSSYRDVRPEVTGDGAFTSKFSVNHYLSYNVNNKLNLGLFESVISVNDGDGGFDASLLNPIIFLRNVEFQRGSRGGNAIVGLTGKYKFTNNINAYAQLVIDELRLSEITSGNQNYRNKHGIQVGVKYYDAFKVSNLTLQAEFNQVRPYTYSNNDPLLSYTNTNQALAHPYGANFREFIAIARYHTKRWYGSARLIYGQRGFEGDINDVFFGGNDLFGSEDNRPSDNGIALLQGNRVNSFYADVEVGYLVNPATNLKAFINPIFRDFSAETQTDTVFDTSTLWFNVGFRTDLFNWYFDN
ncbi:gliding motility protein RemB [Dokdonia sp.]|uniref:gliding motility protein RemB n=1 Tax=Dokdonia sp. TaxID=2024995 RepID=UPI003263C0AE